MEEATTSGVLPVHSGATVQSEPSESGNTAVTDCQRCSGHGLPGYALCRECLDALPDGLCTSRVLGVISR